jgi:hypothetical protein
LPQCGYEKNDARRTAKPYCGKPQSVKLFGLHAH